MKPGICPYCHSRLVETKGVFAAKDRFRADSRKGYVFRVTCEKCRRFIGYRRKEVGHGKVQEN